ncbi:MAG: hypothetical protein KJ072_15665 [Verrucomicrobia bacterium]|nr:hypothetical protein [Verrucomicrobiota bacterium]
MVALLQADTRLAGVPVIADDGTYPKTPGRETALAGPGLVLIVWEIESDGLVDATEAGLAAHDVYTPVVIEENPTVCRAEAGVKIEAEKALQYVLENLSGKPANGRRFVVMDPPFKNFGKVNGVRRIVANVSLRTFVS